MTALPGEILPATRAVRSSPEVLAAEDAALFEREAVRDIPATSLQLLRGVKVNAEGQIFRGTTTLAESREDPSRAPAPVAGGLSFLVKNRLLRRTIEVARPCLWVTDGWSLGYFHWLTDALPRLLAALPHLDHPLLLLPASFRSREFIGSTLAALGVDEVRFITRGEVLDLRELWVPSHTAPTGNYREALIRELAGCLRGAIVDGSAAIRRRRIYISRAGARRRRVENEVELLPILASFDVEVVRFEEFAWREQLQLCAEAECLVSIHGAGLTNMMFMEKASRILEIRRRGDDRNNCYYSLASALGHPYFYALGDRGSKGPPEREDLHVDPEVVLRGLDRMLTSHGDAVPRVAAP